MTRLTGVPGRGGHVSAGEPMAGGSFVRDARIREQIGDYAFLSDCHAPALVSRHGSIDWWCPPRVDRPPVFGRLLDPAGGHWSLAAPEVLRATRRYVPNTLIVETTVETHTGEVRFVDGLALEPGARGHELGRRSPAVIMRIVEGIRGFTTVDCDFSPRFEFGLTMPHMRRDPVGVIAWAGPRVLRLHAPVALAVVGGSAHATFTVEAGERLAFAVEFSSTSQNAPADHVDIEAALRDTELAWTSWGAAHSGYDGPRASVARKSAIVLQGLTYGPTGAVMAAATTSLPAAIGGDSNWDYRYAWLRDTSFTGQALWIAACPDEAMRYLKFFVDAAGQPRKGNRVQIMYGVDGRRDLAERTLDHVHGFRASLPVRVGNVAWQQAQLDVMGEVLDLVHRFADQLGPLDDETKQLLIWLADEAADTWESPDTGMWEARDEPRHYLSSKVMCWVALDRAVRLAPLLGEAAAPQRWSQTADDIRAAVLGRGWNPDIGAFTGAFGSDRLDASVLLMPLVGIVPVHDERMQSTIRRIEEHLVRDGLVYRWAGDTNGFILCTFWLVECLALAGDTARAAHLFDEIAGRANDLGLFAEQVDPATGDQVGNFPQAFSHVGLINAAWRLDTITTTTNQQSEVTHEQAP